MTQYLPAYGEVLELKAWLNERGLPRVHFHDACSWSWFEFDEPDEAAGQGVRDFWQARGKDVSFREDGRSFIVTEDT